LESKHKNDPVTSPDALVVLMATQPPVNLSQLHVLLTIVDTGSFTAAAKRLNRATSVVSYTIDMLEAQLGLALFDRGTARRATLTVEGAAVVAEARSVAFGANLFRARVQGLREGLEAEIALAVDQMFPAERLTSALRLFHNRFPMVPVRLHSEVLGGIERLVRSGKSTIGLGCILFMENDGLTHRQVGSVRLIPVAAPDHVLARPDRPDSRECLQIAITERYVVKGRSFGILGEKVWRLSDLNSKHALLVAGIGWGGMPEPLVRDDIEAGRLVRLDLPDWRGSEYPLQVVHKNDSPPGPAARWLIDHLEAQAALINALEAY
jgi:DNA-binding transcriptional LysR family regulator